MKVSLEEFVAISEGEKTQFHILMNPQPRYPGTAKIVYAKHPFAPSVLAGTPAERIADIGDEKMVALAEDSCGNIVEIVGDCPVGKIGDIIVVESEPNKQKLEIVGIRAKGLQQIDGKEAFLFGISVSHRECEKQNECESECWPGLGAYRDDESSDCGGTPWQECHCVCDEYEKHWGRDLFAQDPFVWIIEFKRVGQ
jgi:hypothetical protein